MPEFEPAIIEEIFSRFSDNHFSRTLGIELLKVSQEEVIIGLPVDDRFLQNVGFVHGGVLATLADVCMGFAAVAQTRPDQHVLTGDLRVSYLNPGTGPYLKARGYPIKPGRRLVFTEGEVYKEAEDGSQILICKASATMVVVNREDLRR